MLDSQVGQRVDAAASICKALQHRRRAGLVPISILPLRKDFPRLAVARLKRTTGLEPATFGVGSPPLGR
jgi:hypothetical protein